MAAPRDWVARALASRLGNSRDRLLRGCSYKTYKCSLIRLALFLFYLFNSTVFVFIYLFINYLFILGCKASLSTFQPTFLSAMQPMCRLMSNVSSAIALQLPKFLYIFKKKQPTLFSHFTHQPNCTRGGKVALKHMLVLY